MNTPPFLDRNHLTTGEPPEPRKTIRVIIQVDGQEGLEVHETVMEYEGFSFDPESGLFSFFSKSSPFQGQSPWSVKTAKVLTPEDIVRQVQAEQSQEHSSESEGEVGAREAVQEILRPEAKS